jgi:hypothetical protein
VRRDLDERAIMPSTKIRSRAAVNDVSPYRRTSKKDLLLGDDRRD